MVDWMYIEVSVPLKICEINTKLSHVIPGTDNV